MPRADRRPRRTGARDQRRFDALVEICREAATGRVARPRRGLVPAVHVYADAATWAGLRSEPAELGGYGPIPAGIARDHFTSSAWRAVVIDAVTGLAQAVSDSTYAPTARTRRYLHSRDRNCTFPTCAAAVWFCDADHNVPHATGGCTDRENCGLLCRRHHRLKTFTTWRWQRRPDGSTRWTDPRGTHWDREPVIYEMPLAERAVIDVVAESEVHAQSGRHGRAERPDASKFESYSLRI